MNRVSPTKGFRAASLPPLSPAASPPSQLYSARFSPFAANSRPVPTGLLRTQICPKAPSTGSVLRASQPTTTPPSRDRVSSFSCQKRTTARWWVGRSFKAAMPGCARRAVRWVTLPCVPRRPWWVGARPAPMAFGLSPVARPLTDAALRPSGQHINPNGPPALSAGFPVSQASRTVRPGTPVSPRAAWPGSLS